MVLNFRNERLIMRLQDIYDCRLKKWQGDGMHGRKPKLVDTVEEIFERGLDHKSFSGYKKLSQNKTTKTAKQVQKRT